MQAETPTKNLVELTDEQLQAFKILFPAIAVSAPRPTAASKRKKPKSQFRLEIEAMFKKRYPFS